MNDIEIISGYPAIARLAPQWREAETHGRSGTFQTFDVIVRAAKLAEDMGAEPLVLVFRRGGAAASLLPLRIEHFVGARVGVPLVHPLAQYADVVGANLDPQAFQRASGLLANKGIAALLLRKVRADSGLHAALARYGRSQNAGDTALYIDLGAYDTFDAYERSFSSTTRRNRRQRRKKLEGLAGPLSFSVLRGNAALPAFDTAIEWKRGWLAARGISSPVFDGGAWEQLLRHMVASGQAVVAALAGNDTLLAAEVGIPNDNTYIAYLGAFAPEYSSGSPGQEQMLRTIAWCFERGITRYDLLAPTDAYKRQWTRTETGVAIDDYTVALTTIGRGFAEVRRHVRPVARDLYLRLSPDVRVAGERYAKPAATVAAAVMCTSAVIASLE